MKSGFTLIELSIVLVIIGLIVGGILTGHDLIDAAAQRAQVTQIQRYNTAVYTFLGKYGQLPGDISAAAVSQFAFPIAHSRSGAVGFGDGNGELDGSNCCSAFSWDQGGELLYFWEDLSSNSGLIEGGFNAATNGSSDAANCTTSTACSVYFPLAKIGNGAFVYVYSGYAANCPIWVGCSSNVQVGPNFFGISIINSISNGNDNQGATPPAPVLTVLQAYNIDKKVDDGYPATGSVMAQFLSGGGNSEGEPTWSTNAGAPSATTCYDTSTGIAAYSTTYNGSGLNCGISFLIK